MLTVGVGSVREDIDPRGEVPLKTRLEQWWRSPRGQLTNHNINSVLIRLPGFTIKLCPEAFTTHPTVKQAHYEDFTPTQNGCDRHGNPLGFDPCPSSDRLDIRTTKR
ncbi:hypothetical protein [Laspinema olomoucense]|uniref:Uncharacterized protein n=1 Tax=Laspinema olomoucense D3b TaxID=2953688 RepID=A0ABT2N948_9CYAN|nr:hypothetical protein [Laspinema sp. D3b]MCT7978976.1 hypothetical protein [Laspinema sp. D3b]